MVLLSGGLGRRLRRLAQVGFQEPSQNLLLEAGVGLGVLGFLGLFVAWLEVLNLWTAVGLLLGLILLAARPGYSWLVEFRMQMSNMRPESKLESWLSVFVVGMVAIALIYALAPPVAWDALLYHLTIPKMGIAEGGLILDPTLPETGYPQLSEMLYTWFLLLGSERAPAILHWFFGVFTLVLVWFWGRKWDRLIGYLACAILLSATTFTSLMGKAYIDLSTIFYACLGFAAIETWRREQDRRLIFLAGLLAGLAFSTKYNGVVIGISLAAVFIFRQPKDLVRNLVTFALGALIVSAPWLLKNYVLAGNPTYPFFFNGLGWDNHRSEWYGQGGTGLWSTNLAAWIGAPFLMSLTGSEGADVWHATFGPLFLLLVPIIFIQWKDHEHRPWIEDALIFAVVLYGFWLIGAGTSRLLIQPRFLFPVLPMLAVVASIAVASLVGLRFGQARIWRVLGALIGLVLVLTLASSLINLQRDQAFPAAMGLVTREEYLYHRLGWYFAAIEEINRLRASSLVLFLFEPRSYHCMHARCQPDGILDRWHHAVKMHVSEAEIIRSWKGAGITHVLYYQLGADHLREAGKDPISQREWIKLDDIRDRKLELVENFGDAYLLYALQE
jgi:4-amino-4-deoxy-L-arabinose transferase-like glycosyltransferase